MSKIDRERKIKNMLNGDIWNLKPILTDEEIRKITKEYVVEMIHNDYHISAIDIDDLPCVCRDIERNIIENLQTKLNAGDFDEEAVKSDEAIYKKGYNDGFSKGVVYGSDQ